MSGVKRARSPSPEDTVAALKHSVQGWKDCLWFQGEKIKRLEREIETLKSQNEKSRLYFLAETTALINQQAQAQAIIVALRASLAVPASVGAEVD